MGPPLRCSLAGSPPITTIFQLDISLKDAQGLGDRAHYAGETGAKAVDKSSSFAFRRRSSAGVARGSAHRERRPMTFAFLVNARSLTITDAFFRASRAGGYLFPPDRPTAAVVAALSTHRRRFVLADNGAFNEIGRLARTASAITGPDRWDQILDALRTAADGIDSVAQLTVQLSVAPDAIIGAEDITLAVWLRAGVDEARLRVRRREVARRNVRVASRGAALQQQLAPAEVLTVASAHDYDTANDAGRAFAEAGIRGAAIGFGAFMADDRWAATAKVAGRSRSLGRSLPFRYPRTALVSRGFFDGWNQTGLPAPERFHFLGLGAPIMLPIAALPAMACAAVSFDATSPIKDAVEGTLSVTRPAALKVRTWKVAEAIARGDRTGWSCPCRFCKTFTAAHPFHLDAIRSARSASARPFVSADLRPGASLGSAAPLFRIGTDVLAREAEQARIGHNHWVLGTLTRRLTKRAHDLESIVEISVRQYEANAGAPHYAAAVRLAYEISRPNGHPWS